MRFLIVLLLLLGTALPVHAAEPESAYDRVMRTGVLRCGYLLWPPVFDIDPASGKKSGLWYDYTMEMARQLNLSVTWTEEIGLGEFIAALEAGRIDAMCAPIARLIPRFKGAAFTAPLVYITVMAYVRTDDHRFDAGLDAVNDPAVRITSMEGEFNAVIARMRFPKAQLIEFPPLMGASQGFVNIATGKADVIFSDALTTADYMKANPGQIRALTQENLGIFGGGTAVAGREVALVTMLDAATRSLVETGYIDALVRKYGMADHLLIPDYRTRKAE